MPVKPASWYGDYKPAGWHDSGDNNIPALPGASNNNPGLALPNRRTLGGWYRIVTTNAQGKKVSLVVQHTDLGPAAGINRIDLNARLAHDLGYKANAFPTDKLKVEYHYLGKKKPAWASNPSQPGNVKGKTVTKVQSTSTAGITTALQSQQQTQRVASRGIQAPWFAASARMART